MEFEFDPGKARTNLRKHGVSFAHAEQALRDEMALTIEDPDAMGEQRFVTLGLDTLGRILVVVHVQRGERTRVISARKASAGESKRYHARRIRLQQGKTWPRHCVAGQDPCHHHA